MYTRGIYRIVHLPSGKSYVGSSVRVEKRFQQHVCDLKRGEHHAIRLQRAWNKHGRSNFAFEILEIVPEALDLFAVEQRWMDELKVTTVMGYNSLPEAGSYSGAVQSPKARALKSAAATSRTHSEETKQKMRDAHRARWERMDPETKAQRVARLNAHRVREHSEESRRKMSVAQSGERNGRYGKKPTAETLARISEGRRGIKHTEEAKAKMRGRTLSPEARAKMSAAQRGRAHNFRPMLKALQAYREKNPTHSPEVRAKISEGLRRRAAAKAALGD